MKTKLFEKGSQNWSKRDIASEIDYSDKRSIGTSVTLSSRHNKKLSVASLEEFNKQTKVITKGGGGSIYSDVMSKRSKMSRYSKRGTSLGEKRSTQSILQNIPEGEEIKMESEINKCNICESELTNEETMFNSQIINYKQDLEETKNLKLKINKSDKISETGKDVLDQVLNPEDSAKVHPLLCAK